VRLNSETFDHYAQEARPTRRHSHWSIDVGSSLPKWAMVYDIENRKLRTGLQSGWLTLTTPDPLRLATSSGLLFS